MRESVALVIVGIESFPLLSTQLLRMLCFVFPVNFFLTVLSTWSMHLLLEDFEHEKLLARF